jgi:anaerobic ribonucleoside-triphosphate reductase activating protein
MGCPNCHNPESHSLSGGQEMSVQEVMRKMKAIPSKKPGEPAKHIRGVTFSGGEPFLQAGDVAQLAMEAKRIGWDVCTFTGYTYEELQKRPDTDIQALLTHTDYLIDGPYQHEKRGLDLKFRGSDNQRVIDLETTRRYGTVKLFYS